MNSLIEIIYLWASFFTLVFPNELPNWTSKLAFLFILVFPNEVLIWKRTYKLAFPFIIVFPNELPNWKHIFMDCLFVLVFPSELRNWKRIYKWTSLFTLVVLNTLAKWKQYTKWFVCFHQFQATLMPNTFVSRTFWGWQCCEGKVNDPP